MAAWGLVALLGIACSRRSLQGDGGGTGSIGFDADPAPGIDGGTGVADGAVGPPAAIDAQFPNADANCGQSSTTGGHEPVGILLVLDQSITGDLEGWRSLLSALVGQISNDALATEWGLYVFPKNGPACDASTITAGADLPLSVANRSHLIAHVAGADVSENGTPTAAAIAAGTAYLRSLTAPNYRFLMLVTDGAPTCAGTTGALSADPALAQSDAVAAIAAAWSEGFSTFVVAPSTTTAPGDVAALNALAQAGGNARSQGSDARYFTESTLSELYIPRDDRTCVFALSGQPPAPNDVRVTLNGTTVPRDQSRTNGWDYTSSNLSAIAFHGAWCDMVFSSLSFEINVYYGCPPLLDHGP